MSDLRFEGRAQEVDSDLRDVRRVPWKSDDLRYFSVVYVRFLNLAVESKPWLGWKFGSSQVEETWRQLLQLVCQDEEEGVRALLESVEWESIKDVHDGDGYRPTHHAAAMGLAGMLNLLLDKGFAVDGENFPDKNIDIWSDLTDVMTSQITPLHLAVRHGQCEIVDILLSRQSDFRRCAITGHGELTGMVSPVQLAAVEGHVEIAMKLVGLGADVEADGRYGSAVSSGGVAFARTLIDGGMEIQPATLSLMLMRIANTPVRRRRNAEETLASIRELLELMAELKINPSPAVLTSVSRDWRMSTALAIEATRLMMLHGASLANSTNLLLSAAFKGDEKLVEIMLRLGWNAGASADRMSRKASERLLADISRLSLLPGHAARSVNIGKLNELQRILAEAECHCPTLQQWCRWTILKALAGPHRIESLPLSKPMKEYLLLHDVIAET